MKHIRHTTILVLFFVASSITTHATILPIGQAVNYSTFLYVRDITSSIDHVYFATESGIIRYDKNDQKWEDPLTGADGIDDEDIRQIWVDLFDDRLFAKTGQGLFELDLLFQSWFPISELPRFETQGRHIPPPEMMYPPPGYNYFAGGRLVDPTGRFFLLSDIVDDNAGRFWLGTRGYGVGYANSTSQQIEMMPFGLLQRRVNAIFEDSGSLWVSGAIVNEFRTGLTIFDPDNNEFRYLESGIDPRFPAYDINCLNGDDTYIYMGTPYGLLVMGRESEQIEYTLDKRSGLIDENIISLALVGDSLFAGTADGLFLLRQNSDTSWFVQPDQFIDRIVFDLEQVDSTLWIGTSNGAYRLKLHSGRLQRFQDPDLITIGNVYDIEHYGDQLWFATDVSLMKLELKTGKTQSYPMATQRLEPRTLAVNDTAAFVGSDKGITVLLHSRPVPITFDYTTADGLPSNYVYSLRLDGDILWIGSDKGLTRFWWNHPDRKE